MKNFKVFLAGAIAVLIAMPAFAGVNVKMKGDFREHFSTFNFFPNATGDTKRHKKDSDFRYSQRVRLSWIAEDDEKKVRGTFGIEVDTIAGQSKSTGTRNGPGGSFEGDATNIEIWLAYLDFELPFDPATRVYMGLQDTEMNPLVFCDTAMGVRLVRGFGDVDVSLAWFRNDGDYSYKSSNTRGYGGPGKDFYDDLYALDVTWNIADNNKLGFFVYFMDAGEDFGESVQSNDTIPYMWWSDDTTRTYWVGLSGAFEQGAFFGGFNGIYQGGKVSGDTDKDISAWLANLELGVKFLERAYAKIGYLYMSGDKGTGDINNFFGIDIDATVTGSVALLENLDWEGAFYGPNIGQYGAQHVYVNLGYEFNDQTEGRIGFVWFNSDKKVETSYGNSRSVGYEFDAQIDHKLTKNLTWSLAGGYMIAGDAWENLAADGDGSDLWRIETRLRFKF
ncbi:MAG: hypothetical protein II967_05060 [Deltaproteobacteria bacterium]|nr:hypothetical protein [Deltaproteobacteria bacterium]